MASFHNCRLSIVVGDLRASKPWTEARWRRAFKARLAELDLHAIYVIGPEDGPFKIGHSKNVESRVTEMMVGSWRELKAHFICWGRGQILVKSLERNVHASLRKAGRHIRGEWFDVTVDEARELIVGTAERYGMRLYSQERIDACRRAKVEAELIEALRL
jgi:hypothetical protein